MNIFLAWGARARGLFADNKGPWGSSGGDDEPPSPEGGGGPWGEPPRRRKRSSGGPGDPTSLDEFFRRSRERFSGGGLPGGFDKSIIFWAFISLVLAWLVFTSVHSIAPGERGVVMQFGRYSYTLGPGVGFTLPSPIDRVKKIDVENIRNVDLGSATGEDLMLTGDQNLIDIAYTVRWNIRTPELYLFELAQPDETIREVAESAMRSVVSRVTLNDAMGDKRADIESQVAENMQRILNIDDEMAGKVLEVLNIKYARG
jgi:membrane protease subunit HflK